MDGGIEPSAHQDAHVVGAQSIVNRRPPQLSEMIDIVADRRYRTCPSVGSIQ